MKKGAFFAAIDVGTSKVCTLVGRQDAAREMQVVGVGLVPSRGMRKGMVSNLSDVQQVVQASVREAEAQAGVSISSAYVGLTGSHINYINSRASLDNRRYENPVGGGDVDQVIQACYAQSAASGGRVLHVIPRNFAVDGHWGVRNPVGMYTSTLEVESHVVRGDSSPIDNLVEALHRAGVTPRGLVLEPLASAEAVLVGEEREMGVVLVDIGGGTSDMSIFLDGNIWHTGIIPVGGFQFTQDVSIAFTTPFGAAEEAKVRYGNAIPEMIDAEEMIRLPGFGESMVYKVPRQKLCQVLHERMEELLRIVMVQIKESGLESAPPGGLVLTGGSAKMPGLEQLARGMFPGPVRIGVPKAAAWVPRNLEDPSFATALGLLLWDARHETGNGSSGNGNGANGHGGAARLSGFKQWFTNLAQRVHI
ncbi:MAG: FtsA protein [Dehalococcoidia bacterium]|nr:FtsA protein [Dehalococcoidia bacterium]